MKCHSGVGYLVTEILDPEVSFWQNETDLGDIRGPTPRGFRAIMIRWSSLMG